MPTDSDNDRLPFEPNRQRKKPPKQAKAKAKASSTSAAVGTSKTLSRTRREDAQIPEVVSRRMFRRMVVFSGIPVGLGIVIFFASYIVITQHIAELPNVAVLLVTLGCFGLSVLGVSYGALSASWDEQSTGSWLGFDQFKVNLERLVGSWRQAREERRNNS
jgi:hypothetical protein